MFQIGGIPHWLKQRTEHLLTFLDFSPQEVCEVEWSEFYLELQREEKELGQHYVQREKEKAAMFKEEEQQVSMPVWLKFVCWDLKYLTF